MARINVSIPDELKATMDNIEDVNWSEVARNAFDREVRKRKRIDGMNTAAITERLRASYEDQREDDKENGSIFGGSWAAEAAEFADLRDLQRFGEAAAEALYRWRMMDTVLDRWDQEEFWEAQEVEPSEVTLAFCEGFVEAALEVWERVREDVVD